MNMTFETAYNGLPASGFTNYVTPIEPPDTSGSKTPYIVPDLNNTEYASYDFQPSNIAPDLANLTSELFTIGGAVCGSIGGWKSGRLAAEIESKGTALLLPAVRLVKNQLVECFGWLPLWQSSACKTALQFSERYGTKLIPAARGGVAGGITGAIAGYITGYIAGSAADWCMDKLTKR
jgi:hypothetical protein